MAFNDQLNSAKQSTTNFFKTIFKVIIVLIILGFVFTYIGTRFPYSEGDRAGVVSKLSKKGYVIKTLEGELNVGAQGQVGNMSNNLWAFTIEGGNDKLNKDIENAMTSGKRVKLHYEQRYLKFFWMGDSEYFITSVDAAQ
ncbi:MAG: hypothetical protein U5N85_18435 [Arcicella sp.]|nr:hypothetical protein [Arcicella sp.]